MKKIDVIYDENGYIESVSDNSIHIEQENDSLVVNAHITTDKKVRAYIRAANNNSTVTDELTPEEGFYSCVVGSDYMSKGTLYIGFEMYDDAGYTERLEPLKIYIDSFVNLGGGTSDNVYVVTVKVGSVKTLANGMPATVENVGTKKDMILNFGLPRGEQGIKGDKGDTGAQGQKGDKGDKGDPFEYDDFTDEQLEKLKGPKGDKGDKGDKGNQGIQGIQGVQGKDGYTPVKGVDYFTPADIVSLGIDAKADKTDVEQLEEDVYASIDGVREDIEVARYDLEGKINLKADTSYVDNKVDKVSGKGLSTNDFTNALKIRLENNTFDGYIAAGLNESDGTVEEFDFDSYTSTGIYKLYEGNTSDDTPPTQYILCVDTSYDEGWTRQSLINLSTGEIKIRNFIGAEWKKISVSQTDLDNAIGDIETSLENIIEKYGLGGDGV